MAEPVHPKNVSGVRGAAGRVEMGNLNGRNGDRASRLELIGRVQLAYEQLRDTMQRYREDSPRARMAIAAAKRRLSMLNRALAVLALEVAAQQPEAA
jgi:hypothetical protein